MKIDFSPLEKALGQLRKSLDYFNSDLAKGNADLKEQFRAASIQAFEYTYELAFKMMRRQLAQIVVNPSQLKEIGFMEVVRLGKEAGLVAEVADYRAFREMRNITSHTYDADKAADIMTVMDAFTAEMALLLKELKKRNIENDPAR